MSDRPDPDQLLNDIYETLEQSLKVLEEGGAVDANLMQEKAQEVCKVIADLPEKEAKNFEPKLKEVIEHFSSVSEKLQSQKDSIEQDIGDFDHRRNAKRAYQTASILYSNNDNDDQ